MRIARHYRVSGHVQGVGFRFFTADTAAREGVDGWVRNCADGTVEIVAEGSEESLLRFERTVKQGPRNAQVTRLDITPVDLAGAHSGFSIRG